MAIKASEHFKTYHNSNGPDITTVARPVLEQDGLYFKDIDGSGTVSKVNDWRLSAEERAAAYVQELTVDEKIAAAVHSNGGKVIANINFPLAWLVGNVEQHADALLAGFETYPAATLDVLFGRYNPTGKLPITLPRNDAVLAVNADGVCVSPNDVPGYDKDLYMPDALKDENGKAYAYRDTAGNYYELNFGLQY